MGEENVVNGVHCGIDLLRRMVVALLKIVAHNNNMPRGITMFRERITSRHPFYWLLDIEQALYILILFARASLLISVRCG